MKEEQGLRSSFEIAMARFGASQDDEAPLTAEAKAAIQEARTECEAKVAESKILMESERRRLMVSRDQDAFVKIERITSELADKIRGLEVDRDAKIAKIRIGPLA